MTKTIDNSIYRSLGHAWWDENEGAFATIRFFVNPVRFAYFSRILNGSNVKTVLDVGCGGGLLSEEFARAGYRVSGVDPAPETIATARAHAAESGLDIDYRIGAGEQLPFGGGVFDAVVCCDVLEHVDDVARVLAEIARVLKPGGLFFYDTINRTWASKIAMIKVMQEWPSTAFAAPNAHVWEKFIKPAELTALLEQAGMENQDLRGIGPGVNPIAVWRGFRDRVQGVISYRELGRRLRFHESSDLKTSYMGYALKRTNATSQPGNS